MVGILSLPDTFHFQVQEEAFCDGVIPTISLTAHTVNETVPLKHLLVQRAGILTAAIRMDDQSWDWLPLSDRHAQGIVDQLDEYARRHGPADHFACIQIEDRGQVQRKRKASAVFTSTTPASMI